MGASHPPAGSLAGHVGLVVLLALASPAVADLGQPPSYYSVVLSGQPLGRTVPVFEIGDGLWVPTALLAEVRPAAANDEIRILEGVDFARLAGPAGGSGLAYEVDPRRRELRIAHLRSPQSGLTERRGASSTARRGIVAGLPEPAPPAPTESTQPTASRSAVAEPYEAFLSIRLNELSTGSTTLVLRAADGEVLVSSADLDAWRLAPPEVDPVERAAIEYFPLSAVPGVRFEVDEPTQELSIVAEPTAFAPTVVDARFFQYGEPTRPGYGLFLNYDGVVEDRGAFDYVNAGVELGLFTPGGVGRTSFVGRALDDPQQEQALRLETSWRADFPERRSSLVIGDTLSRPGSWGRSARLGGIRYATNFATRPDFITYALPTVHGEAITPSTIDLLADRIFRSRQRVPPGPFQINDVPVFDGRGELQFVVRDALGREVIQHLPFYVSLGLLKRGLHDFSYEAGAIRRNFALAANDYGRGLFSLTHRYGFTDGFTGEVRAEILEDQQAFGLGGSFLASPLGTFSLTAVGSDSPRGEGVLGIAGFDTRTRRARFAVQVERASRDFSQLGTLPGELAPELLLRSRLGFSSRRLGSISFSYFRQEQRAGSVVDALTAIYNRALPGGYFVSLVGIGPIDGNGDSSLLLTVSRFLGRRTTLNVTAAAREHADPRGGVSVQHTPPLGTGYGYRVAASGGEPERLTGELRVNAPQTTFAITGDRIEGESGVRFRLAGSVVGLGGDWFLSRPIGNGFAVVDAGGVPDVRVRLYNQVVARTGRSGRAVVPGLVPYRDNAIRLESEDLPLDAEFGDLSATGIPYFGSGLRIDFPVRHSRSAVVTLVLRSGEPVPLGARVTVGAAEHEHPVARRGEVFLTGLDTLNEVRAVWPGGSCTAVLLLEAGGEILPRLDPVECVEP